MITWTLILFSIVSLIIYYTFFGSKNKKQLPGPRGLPLFGNLFQLDKFQHISYGKWAKEFGPIYEIKLATQRMVVVSDHKMLKEMFSQSVFSGRMEVPFFDFGSIGELHGVLNTEGPHWEELRHFTLRQLRDFGFGKSTMEESIMTEVNGVIESLLETTGRPVSTVKDTLLVAVINSLWFIVVGIRHKNGDPGLRASTKKLNDSAQDIIRSGVLFFPWTAKWFPKLSGYSATREVLKDFIKYIQDPIEEHVKTYDENHQRDFTDVFLKEVYATKNAKSAFYGNVGMENLLGTLADLYLAGSETTATTLTWMILYLTKTAGVQKKFQEEIESITGNTRPCSVADRPKMPYTEAIIAETLRYSSIVAVGLQHKTLHDTEFKGHFIPKGTLITPNEYYIHHDPALWGDPENFRPERFLSPDGKIFKKHDALIPFSIGRRQCLGESLARDSLFLFATNIFQRFSVEFDRNGPDNGFEPEYSLLSLSPKPFNVILKDRLK